MTTGSDCLFCAIVRGEVPATRVDEDERTITFMDLNPATEGHALVVPREHARDLLDISTGDLAACSVAAQRMAARAVERLGARGVNLLNSCGSHAWQTVFHFHLHVVPRYDDDRDRLQLPWVPAPGEPGAIDAVAAKLRT